MKEDPYQSKDSSRKFTCGDGTATSIKKGRFFVENAKTESTARQEQGKADSSEIQQLLNVIEKQSEQLEILFDMVRNISGDDKLFQREFQDCSTSVYEGIERLKKTLGNG